MLSEETIEQLRRILKEDYGKEMSHHEVFETGLALVRFFDVLAKVDFASGDGKQTGLDNSALLARQLGD